jgi:hypothetical protein
MKISILFCILFLASCSLASEQTKISKDRDEFIPTMTGAGCEIIAYREIEKGKTYRSREIKCAENKKDRFWDQEVY